MEGVFTTFLICENTTAYYVEKIVIFSKPTRKTWTISSLDFV